MRVEDLAQHHALIVDDNMLNLQSLTRMISHHGVATTSVTSAESALRTLQEAKKAGKAFWLALIDVEMPEMDGFQLAKELNENRGLVENAIMMITVRTMVGDVAARCSEVGIQNCLIKPILSREFLDAIRYFLENRVPH